MSYAKSFWTPNEHDVGKYWRSFYNKYLTQEITPETIEQIVQDHHPNWSKGHIKDMAELRLGYAVFVTRGTQTYDEIMKIAEASKELYKRDMAHLAVDLKDMLVDKRCRTTIVEQWRSIFGLLDMDQLFDQDLGPEYRDQLGTVRSYIDQWKGPGRHYPRNAVFNRAFEQICVIFELCILRTIIEKTWKNETGFGAWTGEEFYFVDQYYSERSHWLGLDSDWSLDNVSVVDPAEIELCTSEHGPPGKSVNLPMFDLFRQHVLALLCDFVDELMMFNRHRAIKGSACCHECGQYYPRSFYGYGQKYCSDQCKARASKRRQREKRSHAAYKRRSLK